MSKPSQYIKFPAQGTGSGHQIFYTGLHHQCCETEVRGFKQGVTIGEERQLFESDSFVYKANQVETVAHARSASTQVLMGIKECSDIRLSYTFISIHELLLLGDKGLLLSKHTVS